MALDDVIIPTARQVIYDTWGSFPTAGLEKGDLAWATDRLCLYRWSGSDWLPIGISSRNGNYVDIGDPADYPESSLYQADDYNRLYMVVLGTWTQITAEAFPPEFAVGDIIAVAAAGEVSLQSEAWTKVKEILIATGGTIRTYFELKSSSSSGYAKGVIRKNGVEFGTERSMHSTTWEGFTEDLAFDAGDLVQLYMAISNDSYTAYCRCFQLKANRYHSHAVALD